MRLIYAGIALLFASAGFADTITLKRGRVINGTYLGGTARTVRVDDGVNVRTLAVSDIQRIEFGGSYDTSAKRESAPPMPAPRPAPPSARDSKVNPKDGLRYIFIPPGRFTMGCSREDNECLIPGQTSPNNPNVFWRTHRLAAGNGEEPPHEYAILKGFYMGQTPVTQAAYERVTGQNPSIFKDRGDGYGGANLPVDAVSWTGAQEYCQAVGMRLPTEAEWEYAARAGSTASRYGDIDQIAWYSGNSGGRTHEVGQKTPNAFGLYDMLGNVCEWTSDRFDARIHTLRGSMWVFNSRSSRVSQRNGGIPQQAYGGTGFRCVGK